MNNTISTLHEKVTLLKNSWDVSKTSANMYEEILNTRASIILLRTEDNNTKEIFEVTIPKPPAKFRGTQFSALRWNSHDYKYIGPFREYKKRYLRCSASKID